MTRFGGQKETTLETMQSWFGLKEGHRDFSIQTEGDRRLFFARHELDDELQRRLKRGFRTDNPPKMVLYGEWGVGKTHTMRHIQYVIEEQASYKAVVVFVELPDITKKATFQVAHGALLDALGIDRAKNWLLHFQTKHQSDAREQIQDFTQSGDIAIAFSNLLGFGEASRIAWDWLRGVRLSAGDAKMVSLPPVLDQSGHFVKVLQMLGRLAREVEDSMLVFMLDEATKLDAVTDSDSIAHWTNAFKLLADDNTKEVGIVVSISVVDLDEIAEPLHDPQVISRFNRSNYVRLSNLSEEETRDFMCDLVREWVDDSERDALIAAFGGEADGQGISAKTFPFTDEGLEVAARYAAYRDGGGYTTPRDIQKILDDLLNRAIDDKRHLLSSAYLNSVVNT
jgi:Cdc6-like AAA superfamily ATPase